jgi:predicted ATP-dependent endonuclease of OLD family
LVSNYDEGDSSDQKQSKTPSSVSIFITQGNTKQFFLDDVGAGLGEVIYLLSLTFGLSESVVLLDEPALNLHPQLLRSLISQIITSNNRKDFQLEDKPEANNNQFIIITHSPELTDYLLFDVGTTIFYIRKNSAGSTEINSLDNPTKEWLKKRKSQLSYTIDSRLFFGRALILTEGDSDKNLFIGAIKYFASIDSKLDLEGKEIMTLSAGSKDNFPKYKKLIDAFKIPCVFIGVTAC